MATFLLDGAELTADWAMQVADRDCPELKVWAEEALREDEEKEGSGVDGGHDEL